MSSKLKLLITAVLALGALASFTSIASATLQTERGGAITSRSLGKVTFHSNLSDVKCLVTLRGTLSNARIAQTAGTSFGEITEVAIASCEGASGVAVLGLPWPTRYVNFTRTGLEFDIHNASWNLQEVFGGLECLYRGDPVATVALTEVGSERFTTGLVRSNETSVARGAGQSGFCPASGRLQATFGLEPQQTITHS
jgi:hypothetical protein